MDLTPLEFTDFFLDFVVALGVGGLIGLEREHRRDQTQVIAGVRTFPLFSIGGYMLTLIAREAVGGALPSALLLATGLLGVVAIAIAFLWVRHQLGVTGMTTPMAMIVTFLLGVLIGYGFVQEAIVIGVATTFILLTKDRLHKFAEILSDDEIMGALQFITVLFILFPIVQRVEAPVFGQEWIGRGGLVDPYATLLVVIFVSAISFASFLAMRVVGARRGAIVSGLLGGLVNSEATSVSLAEQASAEPALVRVAVAGSLLATTTMFVRNLAIAGFADATLTVAREMLVPLALMALAGAAFATWRYRRRGPEEQGTIRPPRISNPFALLPALRFAALYLALTVLATLAQENLGPAGVYATALGGLVSAGAVTASVASLWATGAVPLEVAVRTAVLASVIGAANKLVILRATNRDVYRKARLPFGVLSGVGVVALAVAFLT